MSDARLPVLLYFCYGKQEIYDQAIYSILSLFHVYDGPPSDCRVVVYCDRPQAFTALPVETVTVDQPQLDRWLDGGDYIHRRKTCVLIDALERFGGQVIFIDSDTYYRRRPDRLFARVGPGQACLHIREGFVQSTGTAPDRTLLRQLEVGDYNLPSGAPVTIERRTPMWNTGVAGVDAADIARVHDALALSDAIWAGADPAGPDGKKVHHGEQFAMGYAFRDCRITEAADCVYHYWPWHTKAAVNARLPDLVRSGLADQSPANLARLYAARWRDGGVDAVKDSAKMALRRSALALGLPLRGVRRSVR